VMKLLLGSHLIFILMQLSCSITLHVNQLQFLYLYSHIRDEVIVRLTFSFHILVQLSCSIT
jgi:hypothetical protein